MSIHSRILRLIITHDSASNIFSFFLYQQSKIRGSCYMLGAYTAIARNTADSASKFQCHYYVVKMAMLVESN